jgi:peptidyl-prolyl cis-trans isomerase SurA
MPKKLLLLTLFVSFSIALFSQTLFTYGNKSVSKTEFLKAYNKNPNLEERNNKKALQEYLDLYINYKLKVQAAFNDKLNEQPSFKYESNNFRKQITDNFINEEANIDALIKEAFNRSQNDIELQQIFIEVKPGTDFNQANQQISKAYEALKSGKDFGETCVAFSNDEGTKQSKGKLGYITVFTLPYEFENEAYKLKPGQYSVPFKSNLGYHIFKNISERSAAGKRKIAQILITIPPGATEENKKNFAAIADTVYNKINRGIDFGKLVSEYSTDRASLNNFGVLPEIAVGQYDADFEEKVFSMQHVGDVSKPFVTQYGYHIVKLLEVTPISKDFSEPMTAALIKQQVEKADRLTIAKKSLTKKWMTLCNFKSAVFDEQEFLIFTDSAIKGASLADFKKVTPSTVLFSFTKQKITAGDWSKFVKAIKQSNNSLASYSTITLLREYEKIVCSEYYHDHLIEFNSGLQQQCTEFDEANLLFGAMDKYVWSKASEDSAGLRNFYATHQQKYKWAPGVSAIIITATSKNIADEVVSKLKNNVRQWREIVTSYGTAISTDSSRYENNQLPIKQKIEPFIDFISTPEKINNDEAYTFIYVTAVHTKPDVRTFDDARGLVINDYQQVLEQKWIADLKKKYPVKINETVWNTVK